MNNNWNIIKQIKKDKPLCFIHTPKCGGTYAASILSELKIKNKKHTQATLKDKEEFITFTIIREPIERFESLVNFRLGQKRIEYVSHKNDFPEKAISFYNDKNKTLDEVIKVFKKEDFYKFTPFNSLEYWTKNIDIVITIDQLFDFLVFFDYNYNPFFFDMKKNVSIKERGTFSESTKSRLKKIFKKDIIIYNSFILPL
jgi:hypothetical protein